MKKKEKTSLQDMTAERIQRWYPPDFDTPAVKFVLKQQEADPGRYYPIILVDLLCNEDVPLDMSMRSHIASMIMDLMFESDQGRKRLTNLWDAERYSDRKKELIANGMSALKAEETVAEENRLTLDALRRRIQRAK
jgi:hypothetical protein